MIEVDNRSDGGRLQSEGREEGGGGSSQIFDQLYIWGFRYLNGDHALVR